MATRSSDNPRDFNGSKPPFSEGLTPLAKESFIVKYRKTGGGRGEE